MWSKLETESFLELSIPNIHLLLELLQTIYLQCADCTLFSLGELILNTESCLHQILGLVKGNNVRLWVFLPFPFEVVVEYQVSIQINYSFKDRMRDKLFNIGVLYLNDSLSLGDYTFD